MAAMNAPNHRKSAWTIPCLVALFACVGFAAGSDGAQTAASSDNLAAATSQHSAVPAGTILPVVLRTTVTPANAKQGQSIHGEVAQDIPLADGSRIRRGSKVEGRVVNVVSAANGADTQISIRFDRLNSHGQPIPIITDLRAMAGFMTVLEAGIPGQGTGEGEVANWLDTTQIGGDSVFGVGGLVKTSDNQVVGKSLVSGGVLGQARASGKCRGAVDGNDSPQALWVFSANACGIYGLANVSLSHAGRTDPVGTITLDVQTRKAKIQNGAGLLLRVIG